MPKTQPIGIFYEHPDWFRPLFSMLEQRGLPFVRIDAASHMYDPSEGSAGLALAFNRASPSAYTRGRRQTTFHTLSWLRHLERLGVPVVNGSTVYAIEISKAAQIEVLEELGIGYPATRIVNHAAQIPAAAQTLSSWITRGDVQPSIRQGRTAVRRVDGDSVALDSFIDPIPGPPVVGRLLTPARAAGKDLRTPDGRVQRRPVEVLLEEDAGLRGCGRTNQQQPEKRERGNKSLHETPPR